MSSNLETYFVVAYDHVEGEFYVDDNTAANFFNHDTWDDDAGDCVYRDETDEVAETMLELREKLQEALKFRKIFDKRQGK